MRRELLICGKTTWIPKQDQLQEIYWHKKEGGLHPKDLFHLCSNELEIRKEYYYQFLSPEIGREHV